MSDSKPIVEGINLIARDVEATVAFYRRLGADIPESAIWRSDSGAHHVTVQMPNGFSLEFDSEALAAVYCGGFSPETAGAGRTMIGFSVESREAVDATHGDLLAAGYRSLQEPWDAFWGARAAVVADPDGNAVGIQSPSEPDRRGPPPNL